MIIVINTVIAVAYAFFAYELDAKSMFGAAATRTEHH